MSGPRRALALQAAGAGLLFLLMVGLGAWQLRRLEWKEGLIGRFEQRARASPSDLPPRSDWSRLAPQDYEYLHARARGRFEPGREILIFTAAPKGTGAAAGYEVFAPLQLETGGVVLVDRGFIAHSRRSDATRRRPPEGETTVVGLLRAPQSRNIFTPADEPGKGLWYTRDPEKIAAHLGLADAAPFTLEQDAETIPAGSGPDGLFRAGGDALDVPNNHLSYALTWFALALALAAMFALYANGVLKRGRGRSGE